MTDSERFQRASKVVHDVLELPVEACEGFLGEACHGDAALRDQVERMLLHATPPDVVSPSGERVDFPNAFAAPNDATTALSPREIGGYEIRRLLGAGGMGAVYLAEQKEPVARQVALKVIHTSLRKW